MLVRNTYVNRPIPILVVVLAAGVSACAQRPAPPPQKVPVSVVHAERRDVPLTVAATGTVEPARTVSVTAQVGGLLQHVHFAEGDEVREGQVLFEIDSRPYEAALAQAHANLSRDLAQLANASREAERARTLAAGGLGTTEDAQAKQASEDALTATVRADSAALMSSRLNYEYATVRAPISGRTGSLLVKEGNLVSAGSPQPLVTINQIRPILVRFAIPARNLTELQRRGNEALRVIARQGGRDDAPTLEGVLSFFDNHVDSATGTVLLKARYANTDGQLWPGEFVDVTLVLGIQQGATVVPAQAVMSGQRGTYVFTIEGGLAKQQPVTVARTTDSLAVIGSGLEPGATVVIDGQLRLSQNAAVEIKSGLASDNGRSSLGASGALPADSAPARGRAKRGDP